MDTRLLGIPGPVTQSSAVLGKPYESVLGELVSGVVHAILVLIAIEEDTRHRGGSGKRVETGKIMERLLEI